MNAQTIVLDYHREIKGTVTGMTDTHLLVDVDKVSFGKLKHHDWSFGDEVLLPLENITNLDELTIPFKQTA
jgi:hypothetical protein